MMAGMGVHIMYTIVDMLFIGRLGGNAIAAVAFNMPLFLFYLGLTFGLGSGVTASIARFIGSRQKNEADNCAEHAIFIFKLNFGVQGAAIATTISQVVVCCIFIYMLFVKKHAYIQFRMRNFTFSKNIIMDIFRIGIPASLSMIIMYFGQLIFNKILTIYSISAVAAYQIGGRIDMVILLPIMSISAALTTLVGMFYGANENKQLLFIIKYGISRAVIITLIGAISLFLLAPAIIHVFSSDISLVHVKK